MRTTLGKKFIFGLVVVVGMTLPAGWVAQADSMSSTNYKIKDDAFSIGGNESSSSSFWAQDTLGEGLSGEALSSASYKACVGFQCYYVAPFITFSVESGTSYPGSPGGTVNLGTLDRSGVKGSGGSVNSIFLAAETNLPHGVVVLVNDANGGLVSASTPTDQITSQTATLVADQAGYGICVFSATQSGSSPATFAKVAPFDGTCDKTSGHQVGGLTTGQQTILSADKELDTGVSEVLVKASISSTTAAHTDYQDTLTFVATGTY